MLVETFEHPQLGDRSYLLVDLDSRLALVVDPQRDIAPYLEAAARHAARLALTLETHLHNDFVSGARRLADEHGVEVVASRLAHLAFPHRGVAAGDVVELGGLRLEVLATPGHTLEHVSYRVDADPPLLFSGGALIPGGAARIDLFGPEEAERLAEHAWRTIQALLALDPPTRVLATHGSGSFCSTGAHGSPETTVADERLRNRFAGAVDARALLAEATRDVTHIPTYYPKVRARNRQGAPAPPQVPALTRAEFATVLRRRVTVLDARPSQAYAAGHLVGSLHVPLQGAFGPWVAWLAPEDLPLALVVDTDLAGRHALMGLFAVGRDDIRGYVAGLTDGSLVALERIDAARLPEARADLVVDVRWDHEWRAAHVPGALHVPLDELSATADGLPRSRVAIHCASGYRSAIGASLLERAGLRDVVYVFRGLEAYRAAGHPVETA